MPGTSERHFRVPFFSGLRFALIGLSTLCSLLIADCRSKTGPETSEHVTVSFFGWGPGSLLEAKAATRLLAQFTAQTGIQVKYIVAPESVDERLALFQRWVDRKSETPDVLYTDTTWPGILADDFIDLNPYLAEEAKAMWPGAVQSDTVNGKLVAMPFNVEMGVLHYRSDLLRKYGYDRPPRSWKEMERMAARIQTGERAAGNKNFWGFVWQGAAYEGLTCNALEWQASYGGGNIIEGDGVVSVNNPKTIAAIKMAKSWIGTISPPNVLTFMEDDTRSIWDRGNAAFRRDWVWRGTPTGKRPKNSFGTGSQALMPRQDRQVSVLGGQSLAVSKYSRHPSESAELIRFLTSREMQLKLSQEESLLPGIREFYENPTYLDARSQLAPLRAALTAGGIPRPSAICGKHYPEVSRAYYTAVHSALAGQISVEKAMADLQTELVRITGFKPGEPPLDRDIRTVR